MNLTAGGLVEFVAKHTHHTFETLSKKRVFRVEPEDRAFRVIPSSGGRIGLTFPQVAKCVEIFNRTGSFKTSTYTDIGFFSSYFVAIVAEILREEGVPIPSTPSPGWDAEIPTNCPVDEVVLAVARKGQRRFREKLLKQMRSCYVTGLDDERLLRASHIKPYAECEGVEKVDPNNGLLLTPNLDALFDQHLISFEDDGRVMISASLNQKNLRIAGIPDCFRGSVLGERQKCYLAHHRARFAELEKERRD